MGLSIVFAGIKKSVSKFNAVYEAGRTRRAELAPYESTASLLDALKLSSSLMDEARDAIVLALIAEQQDSAHPLWQSLLLAAFEPMLRRLCGRVGAHDRDETEQRVLMAFLEAVQEISTVHPPSRAALHLKRVTERAVWRTRREHRRDATTDVFDEETAACNPHADPVAFTLCATNELAQMLSKEENAKELLEVMAATHGHGETLLEYVARVHADRSDAERHAIYNRLQKQRHRALGRLTTKLMGREAVMAAGRVPAARI